MLIEQGYTQNKYTQKRRIHKFRNAEPQMYAIKKKSTTKIVDLNPLPKSGMEIPHP